MSCSCLKKIFTTILFTVHFFKVRLICLRDCEFKRHVWPTSRRHPQNISSPGRPTTGFRRYPEDVPISTFWIFVFPVKSRNKCLKQGLLHLKNNFSLNHQFVCWSLECPLEIPDVRTFREPSGDDPVMSRAGWDKTYMRKYDLILMRKLQKHLQYYLVTSMNMNI